MPVELTAFASTPTAVHSWEPWLVDLQCHLALRQGLMSWSRHLHLYTRGFIYFVGHCTLPNLPSNAVLPVARIV